MIIKEDVRIVFVMPILNDYESVEVLIQSIREVTSEFQAHYILVDDGSDSLKIDLFREKKFSDVTILPSQLRRGHQIAIMQGIEYANVSFPKADVITLDSDGEDSAENVRSLLNYVMREGALSRIVLIERGKRKNGFLFKLSYGIFKRLFSTITGANLQSGNFLFIPNEYLKSIINIPETRMHISSAILRFCAYKDWITLDRSHRIAGKSKMNLASLSLHAFGAISVWSDVITVRLLVYLSGFTILGFLAIVIFALLFLFGVINSSVPGWTSMVLIQIFTLLVFVITQVVFATLILLRIQQRYSERK